MTNRASRVERIGMSNTITFTRMPGTATHTRIHLVGKSTRAKMPIVRGMLALKASSKAADSMVVNLPSSSHCLKAVACSLLPPIVSLV